MAKLKAHALYSCPVCQNEVSSDDSPHTARLIERNASVYESAKELLQAAKKTLAFIDDLSKSNPGFLGKLVLQDYAQWNEAMIELPRAIAKAEGRT